MNPAEAFKKSKGHAPEQASASSYQKRGSLLFGFLSWMRDLRDERGGIDKQGSPLGNDNPTQDVADWLHGEQKLDCDGKLLGEIQQEIRDVAEGRHPFVSQNSPPAPVAKLHILVEDEIEQRGKKE